MCETRKVQIVWSLFHNFRCGHVDYEKSDQLDLEVLKEGFEGVLGGEAGVGEVAGGVVPFAEAAVVEEFEFFGDDEGDDVVSQTFFEEDEPSHSAVAVL